MLAGQAGGADIGWSQSFSFVGTVLLSGFLLVYLRAILVPFVIAIFLAYLVRKYFSLD